MITVNAIGDACPIPVIKTKKALQELEGSEAVSYTHLDVYKRQFIDRIVEREHMKAELAELLRLHSGDACFDCRAKERQEHIIPVNRAKKARSAWDRVQISRKKGRPVGSDYIENLFKNFIELHGDRCFKDDKAIIGGIAYFEGMPVTVIAQAKGRNTRENIERNFGMPSPDGYRKALRLMKHCLLYTSRCV